MKAMSAILVFVPRIKRIHWNVLSRRVLGSDLHSKTPSRSCMENRLEAGHCSGLVRAEGGGDKLWAPGSQTAGASEILVSLFHPLSLSDGLSQAGVVEEHCKIKHVYINALQILTKTSMTSERVAGPGEFSPKWRVPRIYSSSPGT